MTTRLSHKVGASFSAAAFAASLLMTGSVAAADSTVQSIGCDQEGSARSLTSDVATRLSVANTSAVTVIIYWLDFNGARQPYETILPSGVRNLDTFATHVWLIANDQQQCQGIFVAPQANLTITLS